MFGISKARAVSLVTVVLITAGIGVAGPVKGSEPANLITNGSFEEPDVATGSFAIFANIPGWLHEPAPQAASSSGIEIQDHTGSGGLPDPTAGDQFAELDSDGPSHIYQDITTNPGSTYRLVFLYSARRSTTADQNHFRVSAGPESVEIGPLASSSVNVWVQYTLDFVATQTTTRISFLDLGPEEESNGVGAYIDLVSVEIVNTPPDCSAVAASPTTLRRPNRQLQTIALTGATDPDGPVTLAVTGVMQDEPVGSEPDAAAGASADQVQVRAERDGGGDGRVYQIAFTATDADGGTCSGTVTVSVPHHEGAPAVDSGAIYDSFGP